MKLLIIHAGEFWFKTREKALRNAEELRNSLLEGKELNALVIFTSIEEGDSQCFSELRERFLKDISEVVNKVKPSSIVLYPYAHLSNKLASPEEALEILKDLENGLRNYFSNLKITRAPFGWYKLFKIYCLGHPLSELSKEYNPEKLCLRKDTLYSCSLSKATAEVNHSVADSICNYLNTGGSKVKLPSKINSLLESFGFIMSKKPTDKRYIILSERSVRMYNILDKVSELILKSLDLSYDIIQVKGCIDSINNELWSLNHEQVNSSKEALLIRSAVRHSLGRLTPFAFITESFFALRRESVSELRNILQRALHAALKIYRTLGINELIILNEGFQGIDLVSTLLKNSGWKHIVVNAIRSSGMVDSSRKEKVRLVVELNDKLFLELSGFEILRNDEVSILGTNVLGIYENIILLALAKAGRELNKEVPPSLPLWLNPIQVKLLPIKEKHIEYARKVESELRKYGVRVFIDERKISLGRKIRDAGKEWIPYVAVVGDREVKAEVLNVRIRDEGKQISLTPEELTELIKQKDPTCKLLLPNN